MDDNTLDEARQILTDIRLEGLKAEIERQREQLRIHTILINDLRAALERLIAELIEEEDPPAPPPPEPRDNLGRIN